MDYLHLMETRYSCKEFNQTKIPQQKMRAILQAGVLSPSSLGLEPWTFYVLSDAEKIQKVKEFCNSKKQFDTCSNAVIVAAKNNFNPNGDVVSTALKRRSDYESIKDAYTPYLKRLESRNSHEYGALQAYIAATNMINCAHSLGIDSCIIGGFDEEPINKIFLPNDEFCAIILTFGYRLKEPKYKKIRYSFQDKVKFI